MTGNQGHGLSYTSVNNEETTLQVQRSKITANGNSEISRTERGAVYVELVDNYFSISNSYISKNKESGVHIRLSNRHCEGEGYKPSLIYGNTFEGNIQETMLLESTNRQAKSVTVSGNTLAHNHGFDGRYTTHSVFKVSEVMCNVLDNTFYNNSGHFIFEYQYSDGNETQQRFEGNTLFLNYGRTRSYYDATIFSNGPMRYSNCNIKNPGYRYELRTNYPFVTNPIYAESNWWGVGIEQTIETKIYDKRSYYRLPAVIFKPFKKTLPRHLLSCKYYCLNVTSL